MQVIQVTLGSGATQISQEPRTFQSITIQNNATHVVRVGDASVSATIGISLAASGGIATFENSLEYASDLSEWYLFGTATDKIDVLVMR